MVTEEPEAHIGALSAGPSTLVNVRIVTVYTYII